MIKLPTRYSVVAYMDVLAFDDEESEKIMNELKSVMENVKGVRCVTVEEV